MKLTLGNIWTAMMALQQAGRRHLEIPQLGKYRLSRLEKDLEVEFRAIESARIALIQTHGSEGFSDEAKTQSTGWTVVPGTEGHKAYVAAWDAMCVEEREVKTVPIPVTALGNASNGLEMGEFSALGVLIEE